MYGGMSKAGRSGSFVSIYSMVRGNFRDSKNPPSLKLQFFCFIITDKCLQFKTILLVRRWRGIFPRFPRLPSERLDFIVIDSWRPRRSQHSFLLLVTNRNGLSDEFFTRRPAQKAIFSNLWCTISISNLPYECSLQPGSLFAFLYRLILRSTRVSELGA